MGFDAIIVGGSYAGLSAGLQLARARRRVLVMDAGMRRNRLAYSSHGFLGQDGREPGAIAEDARRQLLAYPTVQWLNMEAVEAEKTTDGFTVTGVSGERFIGRRLLIATGVKDTLPDLPGLAERWGTHVFHCPYCHGYELGGGPIGVLAVTPSALHQALMLPDWGPTTLFLNRAFELEPEQASSLAARGVEVEHEPVAAVGGDPLGVVLASGRVVEVAGLFTQPSTSMVSPLPARLGCAFEAGPMGPFIQVDALRETTVPGVFACGDAAVAMGNLAIAVAEGARAGAAVHQSLSFR